MMTEIRGEAMAVLIVELKADLHANEYITSLMPVNLLSAVMD